MNGDSSNPPNLSSFEQMALASSHTGTLAEEGKPGVLSAYESFKEKTGSPYPFLQWLTPFGFAGVPGMAVGKAYAEKLPGSPSLGEWWESKKTAAAASAPAWSPWSWLFGAKKTGDASEGFNWRNVVGSVILIILAFIIISRALPAVMGDQIEVVVNAAKGAAKKGV